MRLEPAERRRGSRFAVLARMAAVVLWRRRGPRAGRPAGERRPDRPGHGHRQRQRPGRAQHGRANRRRALPRPDRHRDQQDPRLDQDQVLRLLRLGGQPVPEPWPGPAAAEPGRRRCRQGRHHCPEPAQGTRAHVRGHPGVGGRHPGDHDRQDRARVRRGGERPVPGLGGDPVPGQLPDRPAGGDRHPGGHGRPGHPDQQRCGRADGGRGEEGHPALDHRGHPERAGPDRLPQGGALGHGQVPGQRYASASRHRRSCPRSPAPGTRRRRSTCGRRTRPSTP